ncbi:hypothetical protein ACFSC3_02915 [Sphingomonas floccifaciens]|uniref:Lipoprotein n=1 Tax=Sphingomonas floccifaciens TaxID=1844115 RepID=A0ABW4N983_9SPHN
MRLPLIATLAPLTLAAAAPQAAPMLEFRIDEGRNINAFVRQGPAAAHLLLRSGAHPRILAGFPAGNSGVGLWFEDSAPVTWTIVTAPRPVTLRDARGRALHGFETTVSTGAKALRIRQAVLSSIRVLRDYELLKTAPAEVLTSPRMNGDTLVWARDRLDGAAGYRLALTGVAGTRVDTRELRSGRNGRITLKVVGLTGERPLTPLQGATLLTAAAAPDAKTRNALAFLSYEEKFLAGSWRFDTYFGRDTLMSLRLLMPVLQPVAVEDGIASVLARLAPNGEVAHEEDIGEFAVLRNAKEGRGRVDTPIYDYAMVDDDFMLPPVAGAWLLDRPGGQARAAAFLARRNAGGTTNGAALARNFAWVVERTAAFARDPRVANLVGLKGDRLTGQWRDSEEGLGRGKYAYDVNAVFVPASLTAIARFARSGLLDRYLDSAQRARLAAADAQAGVWMAKAPPLFTATIPADAARRSVAAYARTAGVDAAAALATLPTGPLAFNALSLTADGRTVPVLHSDDGFALLFGLPSAGELDRSVGAMLRPFPAGLLTPIGLLVANPAYADASTQARFGRTAYHGTVVWSWQQAVLAAGLARQLERRDLPAATRTVLQRAQGELWRAIGGGGAVRTSELWSWDYRNGRYSVAPFGASSGDADESNAAQLWSTVYLAVNPPAGAR